MKKFVVKGYGYRFTSKEVLDAFCKMEDIKNPEIKTIKEEPNFFDNVVLY